MSWTRPRSGQPDGATGDLQARVVVLEIVSMTALALAMDTSENADVDHARGIAKLIQEAVRHRCDELGIAGEAQRGACSYADELLSTALTSLFPNSSDGH